MILTHYPKSTEPARMEAPTVWMMVGNGTAQDLVRVDFDIEVPAYVSDELQVKLVWGVVGLEDDPDAQAVKDYIALCRSFNAEDREKLEILQKALKTRHYPGGPLAPADYEGSIWDFTQYMARYLAN